MGLPDVLRWLNLKRDMCMTKKQASWFCDYSAVKSGSCPDPEGSPKLFFIFPDLWSDLYNHCYVFEEFIFGETGFI